MDEIKVIAFDLDGTLTQHKSPLEESNISILNRLSEKYTLLMVGAGMCSRIFNQMNGYPISIIGNYGMQYCEYDPETKLLKTVYDDHAECDRPEMERRVKYLREKYGYTTFAGDSVEYHSSGCVTFPILGTKALLSDKLAFDPDHAKRSVMLDEVKRVFHDYTTFIGGSSSFDFAPFPFNKYYALDRYCKDHGLSHQNILYCGDDYGPGGNDADVYNSDFPFICVDDYRKLGEYLKDYLL